MWHDWLTLPPQLPNAPIRVRLGGIEWIDRVRTLHPFYRVAGLEWKATGVYREQVYEDVGRWV